MDIIVFITTVGVIIGIIAGVVQVIQYFQERKAKNKPSVTNSEKLLEEDTSLMKSEQGNSNNLLNDEKKKIDTPLISSLEGDLRVAESPWILEFRYARHTFANQPIIDQKELIRILGRYYYETVGSQIDTSFVLKTERFLNELYLRAADEMLNDELREMIDKAYQLASTLSHAVMKEEIDSEFFAVAKNLGKVLTILGRVLGMYEIR